jgi:hypothetical protein
MSHAGDLHGRAAELSPHTPLSKVLTSVADSVERANNALKRARANNDEADLLSRPYTSNLFYYKRKLAMAVDMTLFDAYDHVKVIEWLRYSESFHEEADYSGAIESLIATCLMDRESPLVAMLLGTQAASLQTCNMATWQATCKSVLDHCCPYAVQAVNADLVASADRMTGEQLDPYCARFTVILDRAKCLRGTLKKDVSDDWLHPHFHRWTMKLGTAQLAAATLVLGPGSTLQDFYWAISRAQRLLGPPEPSASVPAAPDNQRQPELYHMADRDQEEDGAYEEHDRLLALEDDINVGPRCYNCGRNGHAAYDCFRCGRCDSGSHTTSQCYRGRDRG